MEMLWGMRSQKHPERKFPTILDFGPAGHRGGFLVGYPISRKKIPTPKKPGEKIPNPGDKNPQIFENP